MISRLACDRWHVYATEKFFRLRCGGDVHFRITEPAPADSYYVISVKYDTGSVKEKTTTGI
jgi:hypothetical protein